jgi:hypothetical protein
MKAENKSFEPKSLDYYDELKPKASLKVFEENFINEVPLLVEDNSPPLKDRKFTLVKVKPLKLSIKNNANGLAELKLHPVES